ncbi:MAG: anti-sigma factor family protein [Bacillota bacterium]
MKCKYNLEDIINYFEGGISKDRVDEISAHLRDCEKCSADYSSLVLTKKFADRDGRYKGNILESIEKSINKQKYTSRKKWLYNLEGLLYNNRRVIKSTIIMTTVCIFLVLVALNRNVILSGFDTNVETKNPAANKETIDMEDKNASNEAVVEDSSLTDNYVSKGKYAKSPNGEMDAEVIREKDMFVDSILITDKSKESQKIVLENIMYTAIESFTWVDNNHIALCGHVNPSLQVYVVIDAAKKEIVGKYNGIGFTWNKTKNKLYYIQTRPHFESDYGSDKIVDNEGNVYYETKKGKSMIGKIAISENEQNFAFFVSDNAVDKVKLIVTEMGKDNKPKNKSEIDAPFGDIEFHGNSSLTVTGMDGSVSNYDLVRERDMLEIEDNVK